jgi:hypothetical protein
MDLIWPLSGLGFLLGGLVCVLLLLSSRRKRKKK